MEVEAKVDKMDLLRVYLDKFFFIEVVLDSSFNRNRTTKNNNDSDDGKRIEKVEL